MSMHSGLVVLSCVLLLLVLTEVALGANDSYNTSVTDVSADGQISVSSALGCNWIFDSVVYGYSFGENQCIYDSRINTMTDEAQRKSSKFVCNNDNTMIEYEYDNRNCSGDYSDISNVYDDYECVSNQDSCDFVTLVQFDASSNCSIKGTNFDEYISYVVNHCINNSYYSNSQSEYDYQSIYVTCDTNSFRVQKYEDTSDCSGDATFDNTYSAEYYADDDNDYRMYCSTVGEWSDCNESIGIQNSGINNVFIAIGAICIVMKSIMRN